MRSATTRPVRTINPVELDLLDLDSRQLPQPGAQPAGIRRKPHCILRDPPITPAGVMVSNKNVFANFPSRSWPTSLRPRGVVPPDLTVVSWLPLYHDMGLLLGVSATILAGVPTVLTSPVGFLQRPARWIQLPAFGGLVTLFSRTEFRSGGGA